MPVMQGSEYIMSLPGVAKNIIRLNVHPCIRSGTVILSMSKGTMNSVRFVGGPRKSTL
jgi:hypothetical protein